MTGTFDEVHWADDGLLKKKQRTILKKKKGPLGASSTHHLMTILKQRVLFLAKYSSPLVEGHDLYLFPLLVQGHHHVLVFGLHP